MRPQALYLEQEVGGVRYLSFQGVGDSDIRQLTGPLTLANLRKLAYAQPQAFAVFCLYQAWLLAEKGEDGFVPEEALLSLAQTVAQRLLKEEA